MKFFEEKKLNLLQYSIIVIVILLVSACERDYPVVQTAMDSSNLLDETTYVTKQQLLNEIQTEKPDFDGANITPIPFKEDKSKNIAYAIQSGDDGFQLISSDKRLPAILAAVPNANFTIEDIDANPGLSVWMGFMEDKLKRTNAKGVTLRANKNNSWKNDVKSKVGDFQFDNSAIVKRQYNSANLDGEVSGSNNAANKTELANANTRRRWGQLGAFNDFLPTITCDVGDGRRPAGCSLIALAQVIAYNSNSSSYFKPRGYFGYMEQYVYPTSDAHKKNAVADLVDELDGVMSEIGAWITGCNQTGHFPLETFEAAKIFGYANANLEWNHDLNEIKSDIDNDLLVLLAGSHNRIGTKSHMWVCEGYNDNYGGSGDTYLYMNWGWIDESSDLAKEKNGWFLHDDYTQNNDSDYNGGDYSNYHKRKITNLSPVNFEIANNAYAMSLYTWNYMCSENGNTWAIADRGHPGPWETLKFEKYNGSGTYTIKGNNGKYAEVVYDGSIPRIKFTSSVRNNNNAKWIVTQLGNDVYSIKSYANDLYWTTENNGYTKLSSNINSWNNEKPTGNWDSKQMYKIDNI